MQYEFYTIVQSPEARKLDEFMHDGDVFEKGKLLGELSVSTVETESKEKEKEVLEELKKSYETAGYRVLLLIEKKTGENYFEPGIQTISDGRQFSLFKIIIESLGFKVETDKFAHVTSIRK